MQFHQYRGDFFEPMFREVLYPCLEHIRTYFSENGDHVRFRWENERDENIKNGFAIREYERDERNALATFHRDLLSLSFFILAYHFPYFVDDDSRDAIPDNHKIESALTGAILILQPFVVLKSPLVLKSREFL